MPVLWSHNDEWVEGESGVKMVEIVTCQGELGWAGESFTISSPVSIRANQDNTPEMPSVIDLHPPPISPHTFSPFNGPLQHGTFLDLFEIFLC